LSKLALELVGKRITSGGEKLVTGISVTEDCITISLIPAEYYMENNDRKQFT
jgi:hypothetical protein